MMRVARASFITLGLLAGAYAVVIAVRSPDFKPIGQLVFLAAALIAHDGILLPVALGAGLLAARFIANRRARAIVYLALFASVVVTLFALPFLLARGRRADIPSALPRDYPAGWLICLGIIWAVAVLAVLWSTYRVRRCTPTARPENSALAAGYPDSAQRRNPPSPTGR